MSEAPQQANYGSTLVTANAPAYSDEKQQQPQQVVAVPVNAPNPDYAYELDAIKASYQRFVNIDLENIKPTCPQELVQRGLTAETFNDIVDRVRKTKKRSNTNKAFLWPACIFCCGIIGWLLVDRRSVGNTKLSDQLAPILEGYNMDLGQKSIPVRFAWVQGKLRAYFR